MRVLFVHQSAPGQFRHLAQHLAANPENEIVFLGEGARAAGLPGVQWRGYPAQASPEFGRVDSSIRRGRDVARACVALRREGFEPDVVVGHPGWGATMFVKDVLPDTPLLTYCEMYYRPEWQDPGYIAETTVDPAARLRVRAWNADILTSLAVTDRGRSPTRWQRDQHPALFQSRIEVIPDGVDTAEVAPEPAARFVTGEGRVFQPGDEVVTFAARHLEPVRGFTLLMRALPELLARRRRAHIVICGGDGVSYGRPPQDAGCWREAMLREIPLDPARVHFVGALARQDYLDLLRVSALHLYLTVPFVLSWSCMEALAAGCLVLGANVEPVREVIEDGVNGFLVDARDPGALASRAVALLAERATLSSVRQRARAEAIASFDLRQSLAAQQRQIERLL